MRVLLAMRTTQLPSFCSIFFSGEKWRMTWMGRSPTTISAEASRTGATSAGMSAASYWLSASVLTMTSAPRCRQVLSPVMNARARPWFEVCRTTWSAPLSSATWRDASVLPSSMTSHSTVSKPGTWRGRSARVAANASASL